MKNKNNIKVLDEISKGCSMGIDAIKDILEKAEDNKFKELLDMGVITQEEFDAKKKELLGL